MIYCQHWKSLSSDGWFEDWLVTCWMVSGSWKGAWLSLLILARMIVGRRRWRFGPSWKNCKHSHLNSLHASGLLYNEVRNRVVRDLFQLSRVLVRRPWKALSRQSPYMCSGFSVRSANRFHAVINLLSHLAAFCWVVIASSTKKCSKCGCMLKGFWWDVMFRKRKTQAGKLYGASLVGVGTASLAFHASKGKIRDVTRKLDYWTIAVSSACLSSAVFPKVNPLFWVSQLAIIPFRPFYISSINTAAMEVWTASQSHG